MLSSIESSIDIIFQGNSASATGFTTDMALYNWRPSNSHHRSKNLEHFAIRSDVTKLVSLIIQD